MRLTRERVGSRVSNDAEPDRDDLVTFYLEPLQHPAIRVAWLERRSRERLLVDKRRGNELTRLLIHLIAASRASEMFLFETVPKSEVEFLQELAWFVRDQRSLLRATESIDVLDGD